MVGFGDIRVRQVKIESSITLSVLKLETRFWVRCGRKTRVHRLVPSDIRIFFQNYIHKMICTFVYMWGWCDEYSAESRCCDLYRFNVDR